MPCRVAFSIMRRDSGTIGSSLKNRVAIASSKQRTKRLVVVLGMHRSGTSALTAGLRAVNVTLGDRLMGAAPDNPKGYYEDTGVFQLNVKLLQALGLRWYSLAPISSANQLTLQSVPLLAEAGKLLRARCANAPVAFGFKDPRTSLFVPFWRHIFEAEGYDARYILALRNPASVADSLTRRNAFPEERSFLLWLKYSIASVVDTNDERRLVVDYDAIMRDPEFQLQRIARDLELPLDTSELAAYRERFLDSQLRHSERSVDHIATDADWMPLVKEVYAMLREAAEDRIDHAALTTASKGWSAELAQLLEAHASLDVSDQLDLPEEERESSTTAANRSNGAVRSAATLRDEKSSRSERKAASRRSSARGRRMAWSGVSALCVWIIATLFLHFDQQRHVRIAQASVIAAEEGREPLPARLATAMATIVDHELHSDFGWRPNDFPLWGPQTLGDNDANRQIGVILGVRSALAVLKGQIGSADPDLSIAETDFQTDPTQRGNDSAEARYQDGVVHLRQFARRQEETPLDPERIDHGAKNWHFFREWGKFLGTAPTALRDSEHPESRSWTYQTEVDDGFYRTQGYAFVIYCLSEQIVATLRHSPDFSANANEVEGNLAALRDGVTTKPLMVWSDSAREALEKNLHLFGTSVEGKYASAG